MAKTAKNGAELIDTHCHLQFDRLPNPQKAIADAKENGVGRLICVGTTLDDSRQAIKIAMENEEVWAAAGVHPHDADKFTGDKNAAHKLAGLIEKPKVVAIGEIGLDYYRLNSDKSNQKIALKKQIEAGLPSKLPFIFHVRDAQHQDKSDTGQAWEDFWEIFDSYDGLSGIVHSFSAHQSQLEQILKRGLYVGLNGIMTFTKDEAQLTAAKKVPLDRLLLETDAPFLAPAPFRGEVCEPKHIKTIADFLAELRREPVEKLAGATTSNAVKLFGLQ